MSAPVLRLRISRRPLHPDPGPRPAWHVGIRDLREESVMGRVSTNAIVLVDDSVARRHAHVRPRGERWLLVDNGSTNGTWLNGARIRQAKVFDGDTFSIGAHDFVVGLRPETPEPPAWLDLAASPAQISDTDGRQVLFERGDREVTRADARGLQERALIPAEVALYEATAREGLRLWRPAPPPLRAAGVGIERDLVGGVEAHQLVARLRSMKGKLPAAIGRALVAGAAFALGRLDGLGEPRGDDLLVTWSGDVLITVPPGQRPGPITRLADLRRLVAELAGDERLVRPSLAETIEHVGPRDPAVLAGFLASTFPWWRAHQEAWLEEAALV